jgi:very-short-patch-repair endonuclease
MKSRPFAKELRRNMTDAEVNLWSRLRRTELHGAKFRRQHPIGPYIADFAWVTGRLALELDGSTHHTEKGHTYDLRRDAYMQQRGWRVIRIENEDVYKNLEGMCEMIFSFAPPPPSGDATASPSTSPAPAGEEKVART